MLIRNCPHLTKLFVSMKENQGAIPSLNTPKLQITGAQGDRRQGCGAALLVLKLMHFFIFFSVQLKSKTETIHSALLCTKLPLIVKVSLLTAKILCCKTLKFSTTQRRKLLNLVSTTQTTGSTKGYELGNYNLHPSAGLCSAAALHTAMVAGQQYRQLPTNL